MRPTCEKGLKIDEVSEILFNFLWSCDSNTLEKHFQMWQSNLELCCQILNPQKDSLSCARKLLNHESATRSTPSSFCRVKSVKFRVEKAEFQISIDELGLNFESSILLETQN